MTTNEKNNYKINDNLPEKKEDSNNDYQGIIPFKVKDVKSKDGTSSLTLDEDRSPHLGDRLELCKIMTGVNDKDLAKVLVANTIIGTRFQRLWQGDVSNAALAAVMEMRPRDATEALLISQMVAVHFHAINILMRASEADTLPKLEKFTNLATKLNRTFTVQMEALNRYRRGGKQKVTVEHVHVNEGGQAIVGNVAEGGAG